MRSARAQTLRPVLTACGVFLLTASLILPLIAMAQSSTDKVSITPLAYDKKLDCSKCHPFTSPNE